MDMKKFFCACRWGVLMGLGSGGFSYIILLGVGTIYASSTDARILRDIKLAANASHIAPLIVATSETTKDQQLARVIEELNRTKEDLRQTDAALKSLADNISGHFISNYRDTITVIGAGIGIVAALLGGLIVWGYGLVKEGLAKKIKRETEEVHAAVVEKSESRLSYLIYKNLSYSFYRYYRVILDQPTHPGFKGGVELACWFAEGTIAHAFKAHEGEERQKLLNDAKLHLLFHNACRTFISDSEIVNKDVLDQAAIHYKRLTEANESRTDLYSRDTIAWIYVLLGGDVLQKEGKNILRSIFSNPEITVAYRKELEENYKKRGIDLTSLLSGEKL